MQLTASRKHVGNAVVVLLLAGWYVVLAPVTLGGPAGFVEVSGHSMDGTYTTGDLVVTRQQDDYAVGDVITFKVDGGQVIHRIIGGDGDQGYRTQGDNNPDPDPWRPTNDEVVGKSWIHLPGAAWIWHLPANPLFAGASAGLVTLLLLVLDESRKRSSEASATHQAPVAAA